MDKMRKCCISKPCSCFLRQTHEKYTDDTAGITEKEHQLSTQRQTGPGLSSFSHLGLNKIEQLNNWNRTLSAAG